MELSNDLISQFVKITNDSDKKETERTVYGTIRESDGKTYVQIDGSTIFTPITSTTTAKAGDRVTVMIKDHSAVVTGNISAPSATNESLEETKSDITEVNVLLANKVQADEGIFEELRAKNVEISGKVTANEGYIKDLEADNLKINETLEAHKGKFDTVDATFVNVSGQLTAANAEIKTLKATEAEFRSMKTDYGEFKELAADFVTTEELEATNANIESLNTKYANIDFANIDTAAIETFFSKSGMIEGLTVGDHTVTGKLVGVTISGDLIEGNTIKADKLVVKGSDGLYYKLNIEAGVTTSEEVTEEELQNGLSGSVIIAKTITADKISVTDLVAFGANIGGFKIDADSIHSLAKDSATNTTRGFYVDNDGQMAVGDSNNFIKYYKKSDGTYALDISAGQIKLGAKPVMSDEDVENLVTDKIDISGFTSENLLLKSNIEVTNSSYLINRYPMTEKMVAGEKYTISIWGELGEGKRTFSLYLNNGDNGWLAESFTKVDGVYKGTFSGKANDDSIAQDTILVYVKDSSVTGVNSTITKIKLEKGAKATGWTPSPLDTDYIANEYASNVSNELGSRVTQAEIDMVALEGKIVSTVTDANGNTVLTQTGSGWSFNLTDTQTKASNASQGVTDLGNRTSTLEGAVNGEGGLSDRMKALEDTTAYIGVSKDSSGNPLMEFGKNDSKNKLQLTNEKIVFKEGSDEPVTIKDHTLTADNVVVEKDFKHGTFAWATEHVEGTNNYRYSLVWDGE